MPRLFSLFLLFFASSAFAIDCPLGQVDKGGVCTSVCEILQGQSRSYTYDAYIWGEKPTSACIGQYGSACILASESLAVSVDPTGRMWSSTFKFTGQKCSRGDTFSGGTPKPFPYEGDANMNGIPDANEDFDMDGIPNHSDSNPDVNDHLITDTDGDNVPDQLEQFYDELMAAKDESQFIEFECFDDYNCSNARKLSETNRVNAENQRNLLRVIDTLVRNGLSKSDVADALNAYNGTLNKTILNVGRDVNENTTEIKQTVLRSASETSSKVSDLGRDVRSVDRSIESLEQSVSGLASLSEKVRVNALDAEYYSKKAYNAAVEAEKASDGVYTSLSFAREDIEATRDAVQNLPSQINKNTKAVNNLKKVVNNKIGSMETNINDVKTAVNDLKTTVNDVKTNVNDNSTKLDGLVTAMNTVTSSVDENGNRLNGFVAALDSNGDKLDALKTALDALASDNGSGGGDNGSGGGIGNGGDDGGDNGSGGGDNGSGGGDNGSGDGVDYSGFLTDIRAQGKDLLDGEGAFVPADSGFDGAVFITSDDIAALQTDITDLELEFAEELNSFGDIFSIDTDSFNDGEYVEHNLELDVNGSQRSFKSGVMDALLLNAEIIASVILFLAVLLGLKIISRN